ncbi:hypothetical protein [Terracoccus luteus]|uniref:Uncharacterized protein n=1 Tax=Terracoccus luteus TaxID=53356 RepID=A0A839PYZ7_9MICO|nr:hypothetical protein [Terracoccus luteus]MBB2987245.1 hypothetical protein [Terracoccus luteus]MCP2172896.1 hypothetical protein [Terracoccus luteus]
MKLTRTAGLPLAAVALSLTLAACGGGSDSPGGSGGSTPSASSPGSSQPLGGSTMSSSDGMTSMPTEDMTESMTSTMTGEATPTDTMTSSATASASSSAPGSALGTPAPEGAVIKAGASGSLPADVKGWAKQSGSGPATIYSRNGALISISFLSGSKVDSLVSSLTAEQTRAGTGQCGQAGSADNLTCYLGAADGVYNLSADAGEVSLGDLVAFTNAMTEAAGTS